LEINNDLIFYCNAHRAEAKKYFPETIPKQPKLSGAGKQINFAKVEKYLKKIKFKRTSEFDLLHFIYFFIIVKYMQVVDQVPKRLDGEVIAFIEEIAVNLSRRFRDWQWGKNNDVLAEKEKVHLKTMMKALLTIQKLG
jgi:hypothetical protein